jgi:sirohydrochlorin ferrochelatase
MAPATERDRRDAVVVAHGSPSDPAPQDAAMAALAAAIAGHRPGLNIRGATLAGEGSLERALAGLHRPMIYPFFMAEGYFTAEVLPERAARAGSAPIILPAFGSDPALGALAATAALEGAAAHGLDPASSTLLLAAHGSRVRPASRQRTLELMGRLAAATPFRRVVAGFIEERPCLGEMASGLGQALCLPLFTLRAGHVTHDIPLALAGAGFAGAVLPHIGGHRLVPSLIAARLESQAGTVAA